jgi:hypothetical protein
MGWTHDLVAVEESARERDRVRDVSGQLVGPAVRRRFVRATWSLVPQVVGTSTSTSSILT